MNKKLSVVISVMNQLPLAKSCYREIFKNTVDVNTEFVIIDNESTEPIKQEDFPHAKIVRNEKNIGVYPTFKQGFEVATGDILCFLHSDLVIWEGAWDLRVLREFNNRQRLGLVGFVGSDEIDSNGGRGGGTMSNFRGRDLFGIEDSEGKAPTWKGSPASAHGKTITEYYRGAVVDGCVMIISREAWNQIGYREDFPPHHFYDRLISTQMLEANFEVGVLGIAFDHISGQTVNQEKGYQTMAFDWLNNHGLIIGGFDPNHNYDENMYRLAEKLWLGEYRDIKRIVPIKI